MWNLFKSKETKRKEAIIAEQALRAEITQDILRAQELGEFKKKAKQLTLTMLTERKDKMAEALKKQREALYVEAVDAQRKKMKNSSEPWIIIISEEFDPVMGIRLELDWNSAMIKYLKRNGIDGISEDDIIHKYLSKIGHANISENINQFDLPDDLEDPNNIETSNDTST